MRKLASTQRVISVEPINGADRIEMVRVLGWHCVTPKGAYKPGDLCVYIEIDSILPDEPEFAHLSASDRKRLRTRRFKGQISQGLIISTHEAEAIMQRNGRLTDAAVLATEDSDLTAELGIGKYDPPIPEQLKGVAKGTFPTHLVPKTDETRVQSCPKALGEFEGCGIYIATKMDGTSATYLLDFEGTFHVCSRNMELVESQANTYWRIARALDIEARLRRYHEAHGVHLALQGEICGPGIQDNPAGLTESKLYVFNVWSIDDQRYLDYEEFIGACNELGLEHVPIDMVLDPAHHTIPAASVDELLKLATGKYKNGNHREGIVIRPTVERRSYALQGRLSVKVINNEYLLAGGN